jgi:glycosyltransferase involved in cell wall biosynthesis
MWNEEDYIGRTVRAARTVCEGLVEHDVIGDYEILVVDDASTDATGRRADELAEADDHVRVVHHATNRRLGGSIKTGLANAKGELVLYTDADLPFDLGELFKAIRLLDLYEADIVSAYRLDRTSEGPRRAIYSWAYNGMLRWVYGIRLRDINFAFKLIRRRVLDHVQLTSEGSFIDAELLLRASRLGFSIVQFGVDYFPRTRGVSTLSSGPVILKILREMRQLHRDLRRIEPLPPEVLALPRREP